LHRPPIASICEDARANKPKRGFVLRTIDFELVGKTARREARRGAAAVQRCHRPCPRGTLVQGGRGAGHGRRPVRHDRDVAGDRHAAARDGARWRRTRGASGRTLRRRYGRAAPRDRDRRHHRRQAYRQDDEHAWRAAWCLPRRAGGGRYRAGVGAQPVPGRRAGRCRADSRRPRTSARRWRSGLRFYRSRGSTRDSGSSAPTVASS